MAEGISAARLSDLIALIYDCAIDPARWPIALEAMRIEIGGANASLDLVTARSGAPLLNVMTNIPPPYCDTMAEHNHEVIELWGGMEALNASPLDQPNTLLRVNPDLPRLNNRRLVEWARPQGLGDVLGIWLARDADTFGFIGFGRLERDGPFDERELEIAALLLPHLQRAAAINRLLDLAALQRSTFAALFDSLSVPVLLVADGMTLIHANASARDLLDRGVGLRERDGLVSALDSGTDRALAAAIAHATARYDGIGRKGLGIPLRRPDGALWALHVLPLASNDVFRRGRAVAAVFVARSHAPLVAPTEVFAALFGLTPTEGRVFDHVAAGRSVAQTARALSVEDSTVKTHLLRIYDKTGVRRQAELVHMAASLAVPLTQ